MILWFIITIPSHWWRLKANLPRFYASLLDFGDDAFLEVFGVFGWELQPGGGLVLALGVRIASVWVLRRCCRSCLIFKLSIFLLYRCFIWFVLNLWLNLCWRQYKDFITFLSWGKLFSTSFVCHWISPLRSTIGSLWCIVCDWNKVVLLSLLRPEPLKHVYFLWRASPGPTSISDVNSFVFFALKKHIFVFVQIISSNFSSWFKFA